MVWKREDPQGAESLKIRWEIVEFTRGRVLDIGAGLFKAFPHFISVDNCEDTRRFGHPIKPDVFVPDAQDLSLFASEQFDAVFSSHLLEHIPQKSVVRTLREWCRVIKPKGFLVLYLPDKRLYPNVGEPGANPDHKWDPTYVSVVDAMEKVERDWDLVDYQLRDQDNEYSGFYVFQVLN